MGQSAIDAIILGVNVTIFIIALTISINLMSSVMQMSETANDIIQGENGTLIESSENKERIFSGIDLINYSKDSDTKDKYYLCVENTSKTLESYLSSANLNEVIKKKYTIEYLGPYSSKLKFIFKEKI